MGIQEAIIGQWSAYAYNGYGSMEDEILAFLPDHMGWYAYDRGILCERETFTWDLSQEGLLSIHGLRYAVMGDEPGTIEEQASDVALADLTIRICEEPVEWPNEDPKPILTFTKAPFAGGVKFALICANSADIVFPRFQGEGNS